MALCNGIHDSRDTQRRQKDDSDDDCVEGLSAQRAWEQADLVRSARRDKKQVFKSQQQRSQVDSEVLKPKDDLEQQRQRNRELAQKYERLQRRHRRRCETSQADRQALLELYKEHATSSMVAALEEDVNIQGLVVKLQERLRRKHKTYQDNLQRVRQQNNDLHCALEKFRPEDLHACQRTIQQTYAVLSTTLQIIATDVSANHPMPACGHPIAGVVSYTACGRLLCKVCTDDLRNGIAVEEWVMDCRWCCRKCCAVHAIPHQLRLPLTAEWHNGVQDLIQAKSSLAQMM